MRNENNAGDLSGLHQETAVSDGPHAIVAEVAPADTTTITEEAAAVQSGAAEIASEPALATTALADLDRRIRDLEAAIGDLRTLAASAALAANTVPAGRKTQPSYAGQLLAKGAEPRGSGSVDAALGGLSPEQRIAVKAGLLRAGLL